jgi:hypothetical protein
MEKLNKNEITAFIIGENIYRVITTVHGFEMMAERNLNPYHIASTCLALGKKLDKYNNSGKQIMITDDGKNLSTLIAVENYTIVIITVIDKSNPYVKSNTVVEAFNYKLA